MRIRNAAAKCGVSVDLIRRLERRGVISPARRDLNGHRRYSEGDLGALRAAIFPRRRTSRSAAGDVEDAFVIVRRDCRE